MSAPNSGRKTASSASGISQEADAEILIDHSLQLQNWICNATVQDLNRRSNVNIRDTNEMVDEILERENHLISELDCTLEEYEFSKFRKCEVLNKKWNRLVYEPIMTHVESCMSKKPLDELNQEKRDAHQEYINYVNKKKMASLDVYTIDEYYPFKFYPFKESDKFLPRVPCKPQSPSKMRDPTKVNYKGQFEEDRTVLHCDTGKVYDDEEIEAIRLPQLPLAPLGRHGTTCKDWTIDMPLKDINSEVRARSRNRMRGDFNFSTVNLSHPDDDNYPAFQCDECAHIIQSNNVARN